MDISNFKTLKDRYEKYFPAVFFIGGFIFDVLTLSRIDDWFSVLQQGVYLVLSLLIIKYRILEHCNAWKPHSKFEKIWHYADEALHFILGSLLSAYSLFYFVSSSLSTSIIFMTIIFALLVANELPKVQKSGFTLKWALFSICLFSYMFIIVTLGLGTAGFLSFILAILLGSFILLLFFKQISRIQQNVLDLKKTLLVPPGITALTLVVFYILKLLPPIPVSAQYMGVYHSLEKIRNTDVKSETQTLFKMGYHRSRWKFWQNGDQDFAAAPGDRIYCFARIFAPNNFKDKIVFHWLKKNQGEWQTADRVQSEIVGGRNEGFRIYAIKANYEEGDWRVQIETQDGREIGRISFTLTKISDPTNRESRFDIF